MEGKNSRAAFRVEWQGKEEIVYPEQVYAMIINYLCGLVEKKTKRPIEYVVVSVPVNFNADQRACTESAVKAANRHLLAMIDEPSAAAISFTSRNVEDNKTILVYDLGGGTFDVSIMRKLPREYKVLGVDGDSHFGGRDLDKIVFDEIVRQIQTQDASFELTESIKERINVECEKLKINLSTTKENGATHMFDLGGQEYEVALGYNELERLFVPVLEPTMDRVRSCLDACRLTPDDIDHVILIGGSSNWPGVSRIIEQMFDAGKILGSDDPRLAVSRGTLIYASTRFNAGLVTPVMEVRMLPSEANEGMVVPLADDPAGMRSDEGLPVAFGKTVVKTLPPTTTMAPSDGDGDRGLVVPISAAVVLDTIDDEVSPEPIVETVNEEPRNEEPRNEEPIVGTENEEYIFGQSDCEQDFTPMQTPTKGSGATAEPPKPIVEPPLASGTAIINSVVQEAVLPFSIPERVENPLSLTTTSSSTPLTRSTTLDIPLSPPEPFPKPPSVVPPSLPQEPFPKPPGISPLPLPSVVPPLPSVVPPPAPQMGPFWIKLMPGRNYLKVIANGQFVLQRNDTITWSHDLEGNNCELIDVNKSNVLVSDKLHIDLDGREYDFLGKQIKLCIEKGSLILRCSEQIRQIESKPPLSISGVSSSGPSAEPMSLPPINPPPPFVKAVLPLDIGVEVRSGKMSVIIPKNTALPHVGEKMFQANAGSPTVIETQLYQGSNLLECTKNHELGLLKASGLTLGSNGRAQIVVKVKVDEAGCVDLSYHQLGQKEMRCTVYGKVVLDDDLLEELRNKVGVWQRDGSLMQRHKLIYLDTAELLENYKRMNGNDQRCEQWEERLKDTRVCVPSEVTDGLLQHMEDLREQIRREMGYLS